MLFILINSCILATLASFTSLCAQRQLNNQLPWSPKRSFCDHCHHTLCWWQLIPLLGFVLQLGRCHWCNERISLFFPLSELIIVLVTIKSYTHFWYSNLIITCVLLSLLYLSTTDFIAQVIYPAALIGLFPLTLILPQQHFSIINITIELIIISAFIFSLQTITKGLGTGDIEFILATDLIWHWEATAQIVLIGCLLTLIPAVIKKDRKLPLVPGLALGFILRLLFCPY
ncbi:A24 family peptidase [Limosilactobacillus fastidiosus]|uniref:Prepilin peptidase n=1 Tax=Limosilactobacillus fastidiosus TaxID=2759855 RepID=A0ABR6E8B8_9LACO|nr:A24 family peptidase [Limosilactobacillus fastidiosus]MBB1063342.1 prepilin peptidase [Limosilactobacillus fastidiosus]MCD7084611.1 prepilin peptidase [Limosilactobacillus fastidiosus]